MSATTMASMSTSGRARNVLPTSCRRLLPPLLNALLLLAFSLLDVRDIYFKTAWVGPYDTFALTATGYAKFDRTPLALAPVASNTTRPSGWGSFLSQCAAVHTAPGFFLHALANNCTLGATTTTNPWNTRISTPHIAAQLAFVSSMRVDAIAWACCMMLHIDQRPPLCQTHMVAGFLQRCRMEYVTVAMADQVPDGSTAMHELLAMLQLISRSSPTHQITCVEGFEYFGPGEYHAHIYGCGSPNVLESVFIGHHATGVSTLLRPLAWLTVDRLHLMGVDFTLRQNDISVFHMSEKMDGDVTMAHTTLVNFSSSGSLYALMVIIDVVLACIHARSAIEIFQALILPVVRSTQLSAARTAFDDDYTSIFSRSLYRSGPIVALAVTTQLLSWILVLANAVIWTWSDEMNGKVQSLLSALRFWIFFLIAFNALWNVLVFWREHWAFAIARRTFVTTLQLIAVGALVAYMRRNEIFIVGSNKYAVEHQRTLDVVTFVDHLAFGNAYNAEHDFLLSTPLGVLWTVYEPFWSTVAWSIVALLVLLVAKGIWFHVHERRWVAPVRSLGSHAYSRLPAEEMLNIPIRAKSIVRSSLNIDAIGAPLLFDYGIVLRGNQFVSRRGFAEVIPATIELELDGAVGVPAQGLRKIGLQGGPERRSVAKSDVTSGKSKKQIVPSSFRTT